MPMAQGMGTRGRSAQKRTTERIQLRRIISFWGGSGRKPRLKLTVRIRSGLDGMQQLHS